MYDGTTILENSWTLSYKTCLPYDPEICFLDIQPKEMKTWPQKKTCTKIFLAALFIKAKSQRQPSCLSRGKWIIKLLQAYSRLPFSNKTAKPTDTCDNLDESQHHTEGKKQALTKE